MSKCDNKFDDDMKIHVRVYNYPESLIALKNLKAAYIGNYCSGFCLISILMDHMTLYIQKHIMNLVVYCDRQAHISSWNCC